MKISDCIMREAPWINASIAVQLWSKHSTLRTVLRLQCENFLMSSTRFGMEQHTLKSHLQKGSSVIISLLMNTDGAQVFCSSSLNSPFTSSLMSYHLLHTNFLKHSSPGTSSSGVVNKEALPMEW